MDTRNTTGDKPRLKRSEGMQVLDAILAAHLSPKQQEEVSAARERITTAHRAHHAALGTKKGGR